MSAWLRTRLQPWEDRALAPWASGVYAVDASTLERIGRYLPWLRDRKEGSPDLLGGQISALFNLRLQQWERVQWWSNARENCKAHFLTLVESTQQGALLLFDRGYLNFAFFDHLTERGIWWVSRYGNQIGYQIQHVCYQGDGVLDAVVSLGARQPVRLLQFCWQGKQYRYLTNVLDPHLLPLAEVVRLYARRWDIELAFRALKEHVDLHHLWSAKPAVIQVQLWCCLILAQVYHALQVEIAGRTGVEVFDVSLELLIRLTPGWLSRGLTPLEHAMRFGRDLGLIRPSTRHRVGVPWIDPSWVLPPPPWATQSWVRSGSAAGVKHPRQERSQAFAAQWMAAQEDFRKEEGRPAKEAREDHYRGPRVRLKQGTLYLLE